jgi:hypothetical protein
MRTNRLDFLRLLSRYEVIDEGLKRDEGRRTRAVGRGAKDM